ncbi:MAG: NAD(P)-dependent oxidoreductase [Verrucomicrobiota bacterium]|nr:NAD(P)-dependent oxidoreductase [Verrucomicrobiota bacterium]
MKKVLIPTRLDGIAADLLKANGNYLVVQDASKPVEELARLHPDAYALIVRGEKIPADIMDKLPKLKVIVRAGAGYNTIDAKHARKKGIDVMTTPGANSNAVAEEVVALMLADARHIIAADASTRSGKWEKDRFMGREVAEKTVGIVGLGNIGRLVARRLAGFDVKLLGYDPAISGEKAAEFGVALTDLETLFANADYITLHVPENDETQHLIGPRLLAAVKTGATIINCARAGIVDEAALRMAKKERGIRYLNDVYSKDDGGRKSVADIADIMLPHLGANTREANAKAAKRAAEQLIDLDQKGITSFIVNRDIPEGLDEAYCQLAYTLSRLCRCLLGKNATLKMIETSFYGSLEPFADWLLVPITAGIFEDFDLSTDCRAARKHLEDMGIDCVNRKADVRKGYENSMTIDFIGAVDADNLKRMSVRGTVAEGIPMVSRINEFNKLYFEPVGPTAFFLYDDRPGVIGAIGLKLAGAGVNIEDMRNPHDPKTNRSLAILRINQAPSEELMKAISAEIKAIAAFSIKL